MVGKNDDVVINLRVRGTVKLRKAVKQIALNEDLPMQDVVRNALNKAYPELVSVDKPQMEAAVKHGA